MQGMGFHDPNEGASWLPPVGSGREMTFLSFPNRRWRFALAPTSWVGVGAGLVYVWTRAIRYWPWPLPVRMVGFLLLGADGKGTVRLMSGFRQNKAPGAGGKQALKTDRLVGAVAVAQNDDVFIISEQSKMIRFAAAEIPPKEGVVQGVNCMALRHDEVAALTVCAQPAAV